MACMFSFSKFSIFALNLFCLILGIGAIAINFYGLQTSPIGSEEHTFFIVGIILGAFVCISCLFGFYGVLCELLGVNIVYTFFILMLLVLQYLQMKSFQPQAFFNNALEDLQNSWNQVKVQPHFMNAFQDEYHCCGYANSTDYAHKRLPLPSSCYQQHNVTSAINLNTLGCVDALRKSYQFATRREKLLNRTLLCAEATLFLQSLVLSILLYRRRHPSQPYIEPTHHRNDGEPNWNHVNSRTNLLFE